MQQRRVRWLTIRQATTRTTLTLTRVAKPIGDAKPPAGQPTVRR